jgi:hypothetical protein
VLLSKVAPVGAVGSGANVTVRLGDAGSGTLRGASVGEATVIAVGVVTVVTGSGSTLRDVSAGGGSVGWSGCSVVGGWRRW